MPVKDGGQMVVLMSVEVTRKPYNRTLLRDSTNGAYQVKLRSCGSIANAVRADKPSYLISTWPPVAP
jgi:hypothetical protein